MAEGGGNGSRRSARRNGAGRAAIRLQRMLFIGQFCEDVKIYVRSVK